MGEEWALADCKKKLNIACAPRTFDIDVMNPIEGENKLSGIDQRQLC